MRRTAFAAACLLVLAGAPASAITKPGTNAIIVADGSGPILLIDPQAGTQTVLPGSIEADNEPEYTASQDRLVFSSTGRILAADFPSGANRTVVASGPTAPTPTPFQGTIDVSTSPPFSGPSGSPDGATVVFACSTGLCKTPASGGGTSSVPGTVPGDTDPQYSPDGRFIVFDSSEGIFRIDAAGGSRTGPLSGTRSGDDKPAISPDGSRVYFGGTDGIAFVPFPDGGSRSLLPGTRPGDRAPFPSPDGTLVGFDDGTNLFTVSANLSGGRAPVPGGTNANDGHWGTRESATSSTGTITGEVTRTPSGGLFGGFGFGALFGGFGGLFGGLGFGAPAQPVPEAGAVVTASSGQTATTGSDGRYLMAGVPAGSVTLSASVTRTSGGFFALFGGGQPQTVSCTDSVTGSTSATVTVPAGGTAQASFVCPAQASAFGFLGLPFAL